MERLPELEPKLNRHELRVLKLLHPTVWRSPGEVADRHEAERKADPDPNLLRRLFSRSSRAKIYIACWRLVVKGLAEDRHVPELHGTRNRLQYKLSERGLRVRARQSISDAPGDEPLGNPA